MFCSLPNIFCCRPAVASDELLFEFGQATSQARAHTPLPSYEEAIRQRSNPPTRRPNNQPNSSTTTRPAVIRSPHIHMPPRRRVEYNSYMAAVAIPPKLDPLMRLSSRRKKRQSGDSSSSSILTSVRGVSGSGSGSTSASTSN